jgi:acyl carrier protein
MTFAQLVADVLEVDPHEITDLAGPQTLSTWTSLRHLQLVVVLEQAYGLTFSYRDVRQLSTVGEIRAALRARGVPV